MPAFGTGIGFSVTLIFECKITLVAIVMLVFWLSFLFFSMAIPAR